MKRILGILFLVLLILIGSESCNNKKGVSLNPTMPGNVEQLTNFYANRGILDQFGIHNGHEFFAVNIPMSGDYKLTYTTMWGTFDLYLRVLEKALVFVGLQPDDTAQTAMLAKGTITESASTAMVQAAVSYGSVIWYQSGENGWFTFANDEWFTPLTLVQNGEEVESENIVLLTEEQVHPTPPPVVQQPPAQTCIRSLSDNSNGGITTADVSPSGCLRVPYTGGPAAPTPGGCSVALHFDNVPSLTVSVYHKGALSKVFNVGGTSDILENAGYPAACPLELRW